MIATIWTTAFHTLAQLDQAGRLSAMRRGLSGETDQQSGWLILVGCAAAVGLLLMAAKLARQGRRKTPKTDLFHTALRRLELDRRARTDLKLVAQQSKWPQPTAMLLSPANLATAIDAALAQRNDPALRRRMDALAVKLFGQRLPTAEADPSAAAAHGTHTPARQAPRRGKTAPQAQPKPANRVS
jgi:hypothetical protein